MLLSAKWKAISPIKPIPLTLNQPWRKIWMVRLKILDVKVVMMVCNWFDGECVLDSDVYCCCES